ncbi:hypothetical protein C8J57DRAFT_1236889 [Mycena rebaudengoi]|nr:hypothetical protein C8J57DRAFT_1236889 [Mycena rebaudengoi]
MSIFNSLMSSGRVSPPILELSANSSGYQLPHDKLHSDLMRNQPRRHRYPRTKQIVPDKVYDLPTQAQETPNLQNSRIKQEEKEGFFPTSHGSASRIGKKSPTATIAAVLLSDLKADLSGLLNQYLQNEDGSTLQVLLGLITNPAIGDSNILKSFLGVALQEKPLGQRSRTDLVEALTARVVKYQTDIKPTISPPPMSMRNNSAPGSLRTINKVKASTVEPLHPLPADLDITTVEQHFSSTSSAGSFKYFTTTSAGTLHKPPAFSPGPVAGDLFIHVDTQTMNRQVWLYVKENWEDISDKWGEKGMIVHPNFADRVLTVRANQTPNWILRTSAEQKAQQKKREASV